MVVGVVVEGVVVVVVVVVVVAAWRTLGVKRGGRWEEVTISSTDSSDR